VLEPVINFHSCLKFVSNAGAYPSEEPFRWLHSLGLTHRLS
jgi:hypothetical protein